MPQVHTQRLKLATVCQASRPVEPLHRQPVAKRIQGGDPEPSVHELNDWLLAARSPVQVLQLVTKHHQLFSAINAATALARVAKAPRSEQQALCCHAAWPLLLSLLDSHAAAFDSRGISNVFWSLGRIGSESVPEQLQNKLLHQAAGKMEGFQSQSLGNFMWGLATLSLNPGAAILLKAEAHLSKALARAKPQEVSNILWAFAKLQHRLSEDSGTRLLQRYAEVMSTAAPQDIANSLWACSTNGLRPDNHALLLSSTRFLAVLSRATMQEVANSLFAFGKLGHLPAGTFMDSTISFISERLKVCCWLLPSSPAWNPVTLS